MKNQFVMENRTFSAVISKDEGIFVAQCPEIGTVSQGDTLEEALANLKEATELYLEEFPIEHKTEAIMFFNVENGGFKKSLRC